MKTLAFLLACLVPTARSQITPAQLSALRKHAEEACIKEMTGIGW